MKPVSDALRAGELDRAMALAESAVRDAPTSPSARSVLAEVLMIRGEFERAETHLTALARFDPTQEREVQSCLQLLRAESDRQQVFSAGRAPEFLVPPTESMRLRLGALAHLRAGEPARAAEMLLRAGECEPPFHAVAITTPSEPEPSASAEVFTDWDSRFGSTIEGLTATGKYYWIPLSAVASIEFSPVSTLRDLAWRSAIVTFGGGAKEAGPLENVAFLFIPTRYPGSESAADGLLRAGLATEWTDLGEGLGIGIGQRTFLYGEREIAAVSIAALHSAAADRRQPSIASSEASA